MLYMKTDNKKPWLPPCGASA